MSDKLWEVYAVKYADRNDRTRNDSFMFASDHNSNHPMDYFVWVLRCGKEVILVDTGYDEGEAGLRDRPIHHRPAKAIEALGLKAEEISQVIITHLHYDHAGTLADFPNAKFYLQTAEMAYATGPCMCSDVLRMPFTGAHICTAIEALYSGRLHFFDGNGQVAEGVSIHCVGGHSKGLQAVRVKTEAGWMCLASDATHYYENFMTRKPFPIVVDVEQMLAGFDKITALASDVSLVIPGHDPLVRSLFPQEGHSGFVWRLDVGATGPLPIF